MDIAANKSLIFSDNSSINMIDYADVANMSSEAVDKTGKIKCTPTSHRNIAVKYITWKHNRRIDKNIKRATDTKEKIEKVSSELLAEKSVSNVDELEVERLEKKLKILQGDLNVYMSRHSYLEEVYKAELDKYYNRPIKIFGHHLHRISKFFSGIKNYFASKDKVDIDSVDKSAIEDIVNNGFNNLKQGQNPISEENKNSNLNNDVDDNVSDLESQLGLNLHDPVDDNSKVMTDLASEANDTNIVNEKADTDEIDDGTYSFSNDRGEIVQDNIETPAVPQPFKSNTDDNIVVDEPISNIPTNSDLDINNANDSHDFSNVKFDSIDSQYNDIFANDSSKNADTIDLSQVNVLNQNQVKDTLLGELDKYKEKSTSYHTDLDYVQDLDLDNKTLLDPSEFTSEEDLLEKEVKRASSEYMDKQRKLDEEVNKRFNELLNSIGLDSNSDISEEQRNDLKSAIRTNIKAEEEAEKSRIAKEKKEAEEKENKAKLKAETANLVKATIMQLGQSAEDHKKEASKLDSQKEKTVQELETIKSKLKSISDYSKKTASDKGASDLDKMLNGSIGFDYDTGSKRR